MFKYKPPIVYFINFLLFIVFKNLYYNIIFYFTVNNANKVTQNI